MQTHTVGPAIADETVERAFRIAFDYIVATRDVADVAAVQDFVIGALARLLYRGERHPIRLANLAIAAYEQAHDRAACAQAAE